MHLDIFVDLLTFSVAPSLLAHSHGSSNSDGTAKRLSAVPSVSVLHQALAASILAYTFLSSEAISGLSPTSTLSSRLSCSSSSIIISSSSFVRAYFSSEVLTPVGHSSWLLYSSFLYPFLLGSAISIP